VRMSKHLLEIKAPDYSNSQGRPFGYREYDEIVVYEIYNLWLDEMMPLFQRVNTALVYGGIVQIRLPSPLLVSVPLIIWKTYPDKDKIANEAARAGFYFPLDIQKDYAIVGVK